MNVVNAALVQGKIAMPVTFKMVILLVLVKFIYAAGLVGYLFYLVHLAQSNSLSAWQAGFIKGAGFDPATYSYGDHGEFLGAFALPIVFAFLNLIFAAFKKPNLLMGSLLIGVFIFNAGLIGQFLAGICIVLLLLPPSFKYAKALKAQSVAAVK